MRSTFRIVMCVMIGLLGSALASAQSAPRIAGLSEEQQARLESVLATADPAAFADQSQAFWNSDRHRLSAEDKESLRKAFGVSAKQILLAHDALQSLDLSKAQVLLDWATAAASDAEKTQLQTKIAGAFSGGESLEFGQLKAQFTLLSGLAPPGPSYVREREVRQQVAAWLAAQNIAELPITQLNWCFRALAPQIQGEQGFRATWTGFIEAPREGEYTFSISPWNINVTGVPDWSDHRQSVTVTVNGEAVVNSSLETWPPTETAVQLQAGVRTPISYELVYERTDDVRLCPAILSWRGPGISKGVVPPNVLTANEQGQPGLNCTYSWLAAKGDGPSESYSETVVDPNIEFIWHDGLTIGVHSGALKQLADEYASRWRQDPGGFVGEVRRRRSMVALLTCDQLVACLEAVRADTTTPADLSTTNAAQFYAAVRCGAEDEALATLGEWMVLHRDSISRPAESVRGFFDLNRMTLRRLTEHLAFENPDTGIALQDQFLETPDGECVLPAAYTLAYCHLLTGRIDEWIDVLASKLDDNQLTGDRRVTWLLARAMAEEIRQCPAGRNLFGPERLSAGVGWLQEAELISESPPAALRVAQERVARHAALQQWEAAEAMLADRAELAPLKATLTGLKSKAEERTAQQAVAAQAAYVAEIKRRRDAAVKANDSSAVQQYDAVIEANSAAE